MSKENALSAEIFGDRKLGRIPSLAAFFKRSGSVITYER
jgi:hypothetical protein